MRKIKHRRPTRPRAVIEAEKRQRAARHAEREAAYEVAFTQRAQQRYADSGVVGRAAFASVLQACPLTPAQQRYRLKSLEREIRLLQHTYDQLQADLNRESA